MFLRKPPLLTLVLLFIVLGTVALHNVVAFTPDSGRYLAWSNSLAFFEGLKDDSGPELSRYVVRPPLYPLILAPIERLFPYSLVAAKALTLLVGVFTSILFYRWIRETADSFTAAIGLFFFCFNPLVMVYSTQVLSEIPFVLCVIACFLLMRKISAQQESSRMLELGLLCSIVAATYIREAGLFLIPSAATLFLLRQDKKRALVAIVVPLFFYLLWVLRNELLVAGSELPPGSNVNVLLARFYTSEEASMLEELRIRVSNNSTVYADVVGKLVFLSGYVRGPGAFVAADNWMNQFLSRSGIFLTLPLQIATLFFFFTGLYRSWKRSDPMFFPVVVFILFYSGSLLFFPVNDVRYLFPLLPIFLYYVFLGMMSLIREPNRANSVSRQFQIRELAIIAVLAVPNIAWVLHFSENNLRYRTAHGNTFADAEVNARLPAVYSRALDLAGRWIAKNSESSTVVATRWKEVYLWSEGRKVLEVAPDLSAESFEHLIRDYDVRYLVSVVEGGLRDFEIHLALSNRFVYQTVFQVADIEVVEVYPKRSVTRTVTERVGSERALQRDFQRGIEMLQELNTASAESVFTNIISRIGNHSMAVFCQALVKEFQGNYAEAIRLFDSFSALPQAGSLLQQASYHRETIMKLERAESHPAAVVRAALLQEVAARYRELGFHRRADQLLHRSLEAEPSYFPSLILGTVYAWEDGDYPTARRLVEQARALRPMDPQAEGLASILRSADSLRLSKNPSRRAGLQLAIAKELVGIGAREKAIDVLHGPLNEDENQPDALRLLSELYVTKQMFAPAIRQLSRLLLINPEDRQAKEMREKLTKSN